MRNDEIIEETRNILTPIVKEMAKVISSTIDMNFKRIRSQTIDECIEALGKYQAVTKTKDKEKLAWVEGWNTCFSECKKKLEEVQDEKDSN